MDMKKFIKMTMDLYRPFRKAVLGMFAFIVVGQAMSLVSPYIYGKIIDAIISKKEISAIVILAGVSLLVHLFQDINNYLRDRFETSTFDYKVPRHISNKTLGKVLSFSIGQHNNENSGVKQSVINKGEHSLRTLAYNLAYDVFPMALRTIFTITVLMWFNVTLGLVVFVSSFLFVSMTIRMNLKLKDDLKIHNELWDETAKVHSEIIRNMEIVQVNAQEKKVAAEYDKELKKFSGFGVNLWKRYGNFSSLRNLLVSFTDFAVIAIGVYLVYKKAYTPGSLVVFISWSSSVMEQLGRFGSIHRQLLQLFPSVKKFFVMMEVKPDVTVFPNPVRPEKFSGRIEFKNVSFQYPVRSYLEEDKIVSNSGKNKGKAISDVSLVIEAGQRVAFVGHSGAGKLTLAHLIIRAYDPDKGQIKVDGDDLRVIDLHAFREAVGVVEQDVRLFDNTLRYNMVFGLNGKGEAITEDDLHRIAKISCVDRFYDRLEKGFDTIIGEKGIKLSGGERQRVGIARALIKEPNILIFDEATSNLDAENETLIREAVYKASQGRTTIIIAHRLSTIKHVDKIFVFDRGKLVGEGRHDELLKSCEGYKRLIQSQVVSV